ncbi:MAG: hypothetical protein IKE53_07315 [Clostridiales bacterium]|nr:hypothetical protein [Clostridiales bacterium]
MDRSADRRIAANSAFLYFRMILVTLVTLYTSRVTLKVLGVDDFGIYQAVAGVVTFLAFLSNALGTGTSRFITFEMGKENPRLGSLISTLRTAHIVLGLIIVVLGEIVGLWFIFNRLIIPAERFDAAVFAFHFSMIGTFFQIVQVPYNATIIAHEKMIIFAHISISEALIRLLIVFALNLFFFDSLKVYAVLMCISSLLVFLIYRIYCRKVFPETRTRLSFDRDLFKCVASFSGWSLISSSASALTNQGVTVVTNMFFSPAAVTVRSLALRINDAIINFVNSYRMAVNPQIVKRYASDDREGSRKLALDSTKYTYYLLLIVVVPVFFAINPILTLWLGDVPDGLVPFVRLALIQGLFQSLDISLYAPIYASGRIRENAIISPIFDFLQLPVVYILFILGYPPIALAWVSAIAYAVLGIVVKPILVHKVVEYGYGEIIKVLCRCALVTTLSLILPAAISSMLDSGSIYDSIIIMISALLSVTIMVWIAGLEKTARKELTEWVTKGFRKG